MAPKQKKTLQIVAIVIIWLLYPLFFWVLNPLAGLSIAKFGLFPVLLTAWFFGKWGGLAGD